MPSTHTLIGFVVVSATLMVLPGPSNFFILAHGVGEGRRSALQAVAGIETAAAIRVVLTAIGLAAVLVSSTVLFAAVRWAGVVYFLYLAARAVRKGGANAATEAPSGSASTWRSFRKGVTVGLGNPKTVVFFLAFFPQFVQPGRGPAVTQMLILGSIYVGIGAIWDISLAFVSGMVGGWMRRQPRAVVASRRLESIAYLGLAAYTAAAGAQSRR